MPYSVAARNTSAEVHSIAVSVIDRKTSTEEAHAAAFSVDDRQTSTEVAL